ncbi:MAG: phosphoribosyl-ATP diphosphatase [Bacteroidetes bacterium]|nr:MAG: phosphoribosyl-ATP diphosphatase [Bacteroidota bacterium]
MIIPSIDIQNGRAVQLRGGETFVLDGGDPMERLAQFSVAGEVAVIDLDAALGTGSNAELIRQMARQARIRVGGGIRHEKTALDWLDAGAASIIIGTAATPQFCARLPRDRIIAAVDARDGMVVSHGWTSQTTDTVASRIAALAPYVGGFLYTQVENEGRMKGFDMVALQAIADTLALIPCSGPPPRLTFAGGITSTDDIRVLDEMGFDAQVGMALYTGAFSLGDAVSASLRSSSSKSGAGELWPTVVSDESDRVLGLVWSSRESIALAIETRKGIYWSRSRSEIWEKGLTSGHTQELLRVDLDCDRDCLKFTVRQSGPFCHAGTRSCFGETFGLGEVVAMAAAKIAGNDSASGTWKAAHTRGLLANKLIEEAKELADAADHIFNGQATGDLRRSVVLEAADVLYFASVAMARSGVRFEDVMDELRHRNQRVGRRPMMAKSSLPSPTPSAG